MTKDEIDDYLKGGDNMAEEEKIETTEEVETTTEED